MNPQIKQAKLREEFKKFSLDMARRNAVGELPMKYVETKIADFWLAKLSQAKLETLEAIIKEVKNRLLEAKAEFIEFGLQRTEGEIDALSDLLTKLNEQLTLLKNER